MFVVRTGVERNRLGRGGRSAQLRRGLGVALVALCLLPGYAQGGYRVFPIRVDLDAASESGAVTVTNEGPELLRFQLRAAEWTQDESGKDRYGETADLVFFPRIFTLNAGAAQVVRVGKKIPPSSREKSYRLFIEQLPEQRTTEGIGVAIQVSFGVPVFVRPPEGRVSGLVAEAAVTAGAAHAVVRNTGNVHFKIAKTVFQGFDPDGTEVFSEEKDGWYLLSGVSRRVATAIPAGLCPRVARLRVQIRTDRESFAGEAAVLERDCRP